MGICLEQTPQQCGHSQWSERWSQGQCTGTQMWHAQPWPVLLSRSRSLCRTLAEHRHMTPGLSMCFWNTDYSDFRGVSCFPCASETQISMTLEVHLWCCRSVCLLQQLMYTQSLLIAQGRLGLWAVNCFPVWTSKIDYTYAHYCFQCNIHTPRQTKQNKKFCFIFQVPLRPGN